MSDIDTGRGVIHVRGKGSQERLVMPVLLGHASIRSTTRYARVSSELIKKAKSPLERLPKIG